jgi:prefoldin subunit 5
VQQCRSSTSPLLQRVNEANSRIEKDLQSVAKDTTATMAMTAQLDKTATQIDKKIDKLTNEVCMALRKHSKSSLS